ncbi:hypothetical protein BS17DRAFT_770039 [Gyrodon lividus]|nr:hypothetical protein BS17DRAFT_770039 [Gyrodon lividus]
MYPLPKAAVSMSYSKTNWALIERSDVKECVTLSSREPYPNPNYCRSRIVIWWDYHHAYGCRLAWVPNDQGGHMNAEPTNFEGYLAVLLSKAVAKYHSTIPFRPGSLSFSVLALGRLPSHQISMLLPVTLILLLGVFMTYRPYVDMFPVPDGNRDNIDNISQILVFSIFDPSRSLPALMIMTNIYVINSRVPGRCFAFTESPTSPVTLVHADKITLFAQPSVVVSRRPTDSQASRGIFGSTTHRSNDPIPWTYPLSANISSVAIKPSSEERGGDRIDRS